MPACPVCRGSAVRIEWQPADEAFCPCYGAPACHAPPVDLQASDYAEWRCGSCGLEFAEPMVPGSAKFYEWLASTNRSYYAKDRWEYGVVKSLLENQFAQSLRGCDIGCGSGAFLEKISALPDVSVAGLDTNPLGIAQCKAAGLTAYCETVQDFRRRAEWRDLDFVTAFHCIEHTADPLVFTQDALNMLRHGGAFLFSVPYSPTPLEMHYYDPLNHPPHHLTRWNVSSLKQLAVEVGRRPRFHYPPAERSRSRALYALAYRYLHDGTSSGGGRRWSRLAWRHPIRFLRYWRRQRSRETIEGAPAPGVVLVELRQGI